MNQDHISLGRINAHLLHRYTAGIGVALDALIGIKPLHMGRLQKRQQPEMDVSVIIGQGDGRDIAVIDRGQMDALSLHQPSAESQTLGGVVVAADDPDRNLHFCKPVQKGICQLHRFSGWHGFIFL